MCGDGSSGTSALVSVLLLTPSGAEKDFLRARWLRAGSDLAGEEGEVGMAVMPSWPGGREAVYMASGRPTRMSTSSMSPHRRPMIVSSSRRLLRDVYVWLSWRRIPVFEVCERMALGFDVTYSHIMTLQTQEGRDVTFRAFEVMSLRMGIPSSESPTRARHGGTQHSHMRTRSLLIGPREPQPSHPRIPIRRDQYTLIRMITDQPAAQTGPGISPSAMATKNDVNLKPNPTTPHPIPDPTSRPSRTSRSECAQQSCPTTPQAYTPPWQ